MRFDPKAKTATGNVCGAGPAFQCFSTCRWRSITKLCHRNTSSQVWPRGPPEEAGLSVWVGTCGLHGGPENAGGPFAISHMEQSGPGTMPTNVPLRKALTNVCRLQPNARTSPGAMGTGEQWVVSHKPKFVNSAMNMCVIPSLRLEWLFGPQMRMSQVPKIVPLPPVC